MKESSVKIHVNDLAVGMKIKMPGKWIEHPFWKSKITIKSHTEILVIKELNIQHVELLNPHTLPNISTSEFNNANEKISDCLTTDQVDIKDLSECLQQVDVSSRVKESNQKFENFTGRLDEITNLILAGDLSAKKKFHCLSSDLVDYVKSRDNTNTIIISSFGGYYKSTQLAISNASLSIIVAKAMNLSINDINELSKAALLLGLDKLINSDDVKNNNNVAGLRIRTFIEDFNIDDIMSGLSFTKVCYTEVRNTIFQIVKLCTGLGDFFYLNHSKSAKSLLGIYFKKNQSNNDVGLRALNILVKTLGIYPPGTYMKLKKNCFAKVIMSTSEVENPYVIKCSAVNSDHEILHIIDIQDDILELVCCKDIPLSVSKKLNVSMQNFFFI